MYNYIDCIIIWNDKTCNINTYTLDITDGMDERYIYVHCIVSLRHVDELVSSLSSQ